MANKIPMCCVDMAVNIALNKPRNHSAHCQLDKALNALLELCSICNRERAIHPRNDCPMFISERELV